MAAKRTLIYAYLGLLASAGLVAYALSRSDAPATGRYNARIAVPGFQSSALVILADTQGFFRDEGVDAQLEYKLTGRDCLDLVLKGLADYAVVFETPVVHAVLAGTDIAILTELHRSEANTAVVVRADRGILAANDLVGKRVAAVPRTNAEFLLDLVIRSRLIDPSTVLVERLPIDQAVAALRDGTVDAAALWEPYLSQAFADAPTRLARLHSSYYSEFSVLAALDRATVARSDATFAVLRALKRADDYFQSHGDEARAVVDRTLSARGYFVSNATWGRTDIHLGLSATLLAMLDEEAEWYRSKTGPSRRVEMQPLLQSRYVKAVASAQVTYE